MYGLMYFDTEDFLSPPDHPVHQLPGQFAEIMERHGLKGSFHIIGEKARFMERHGQRKVIDALSRHDVSLHFDRGTVPPTTAEELSTLDWFQGVERVLFRELPGIQTLERLFGKCSAITRHGATFAAQIVYAAGKLGKPFFGAPFFNLSGRNVAWFCNNLVFPTGEGGSFDDDYRDDQRFEAKLAQQHAFLQAWMPKLDFVPLFGCHPLKTVMQDFPCYLNFAHGQRRPPDQWRPPVMIEDVSIPTILKNFERRIQVLASVPGLEWTTVGELACLYGQRPVRVSDAVVLDGARAVVAHGGPTYTAALSAGELLYLLARRRLAPAPDYPVPHIMGPVGARPETVRALQVPADLRSACLELIEHGYASGYLPESLSEQQGNLCLESVLLVLACDAIGADPAVVREPKLSPEAVPGVAAACDIVDRLKDWRNHSPAFDQANLSQMFRWQAWTLKPALRPAAYPEGVETGPYLNAAFPFSTQKISE